MTHNSAIHKSTKWKGTVGTRLLGRQAGYVRGKMKLKLWFYIVADEYLLQTCMGKQVKNRVDQLQRAEITVHGDVQAVGYRYVVKRTATKLHIQGYAQNMPDGTVRVIAEEPRNAIQKFIETIRVKEPPITVEHVETKYTKPTGEFKFFAIKYGELAEEMAEGFGTGQSYINLSRAESKRGSQNLRDETKAMRMDMNKNFARMSTKYDAISRNLSGAVKAIQSESVQTRAELIRAVNSLSKLVQAFIEDTQKRRQSRN